MTTKRADRTRTVIRAGLATLLAGMTLAIVSATSAPAGAYVPDPSNHKIEICHATSSATNPYTTPSPAKWQITAPNGHGSDVNDIIPPFPAGSHGGQTWNAYTGYNWNPTTEDFYDAGCGGASQNPDTGDVLLAKVLAGDVPTPAPTSVEFEVSCDSGTVTDPTPTITPGAAAVSVATGVEVDDTCTITENPVPANAAVTFDVGTTTATSTTVTMDADGVTVTATNTYTDGGGNEPTTGTLRVQKVVNGNGTPGLQTFPFTVDCTLDNDAVDLEGAGTQASFSLAPSASHDLTEIPTGALCDINETNNGGANPTTFTVGQGGPVTTNSVDDVAIGEGTSVVVVHNTFTRTGGGDCTENCGGGPNPTAQLSATRACAAGGVLIRVSNSGDAAGTVDVTNSGAVVGNDVVVPVGGSSDVLVPVAEDADYAITVTRVGGSEVTSFGGPRSCEGVGGEVVRPTPAPSPGPSPAPAPAPAPAPTPEPAAQPTVAAPTATPVQGAVQARSLPRTGTDALPLAELGFGLVLIGGAAVFMSRRLASAV